MTAQPARRPEAKFARLDNGLRVVAVDTPHLHQCYVALLVGVGSRHESARDHGLTHFVEHMVFRGTAHYPDANDLNRRAESIGGSLDAMTYRDHCLFGTSCHPTRIVDALDLLREIVLTPKLKHMETERTIIAEEMRESYNEHGELIDIDTLMHAILYPEHGLGQSIEGTAKTLAAFRRADLARHWRRHFCANNSVLVLAGPLGSGRIKALANKAFADMPAGQSTIAYGPLAPLQKNVFRWVDDSGSQVDLRYSFPTFSANEYDVAALNVLSRALCEGLSSRLHAELIDKKGLAYSLSGGPEWFPDAGSFDFDASVAPERCVRLLRELKSFVASAIAHPPTAQEIELVKERYRYGADFMFDAPADLALWVARGLLLGMEWDAQRAERAFLAVSDEDCARVAERVFAQASALVAVGHASKDVKRELRATFTARARRPSRLKRAA